MKKSKKPRSIKRSILLATLMVGLAGGAAYAVLQSQQNTLTGNTISTATANLQLSKDGVSFGNTQTGFGFINIVPGGAAVPTTGQPFYLKNAGGTPLEIHMSVSGTPTNSSNVDLGKVNVLLTTVGSGTPIQSFNLQALMTAHATGGVIISTAPLDIDNIQLYKLQVSMAADAVTGSSASIGNIDFAFSGIAQ